jgi:hypothetical protein
MNHTQVTEVIIRIIITITTHIIITIRTIHITIIIHTIRIIRTTHMAIMVDIDEHIRGHDIVSTRGDFSRFLRRKGPISGLLFLFWRFLIYQRIAMSEEKRTIITMMR